jgi:1-acyl-sn-glycerol-3-phosphate acyltransferase
LLVAWPGQARFMAKRSLFRIPVFGWAMRAGGFIPVDRRNPAQAPEAFAAATAHLAAGTSVVLFPEQMRSRDGRLLPFQRGGFLLALKSRLPILPAGIEGARAVQRRGSLVVRPGIVDVRFGAPVDVAGRRVREARPGGELLAEVRATIAELAGLEADGAILPRGGSAEPRSGAAGG